MSKAARNVETLIKRHKLDLSGLTVLTEAASGSYLYTPVMAAVAGAEKVIAVTKDSRYAKAEDVIEATLRAAKEMGVENQIVIETDKSLIDYSSLDIITNSGFVRPITKDIIQKLKKTAVIPLMWETWEYRGDEVELQACKDNDILVLGTYESHPDVELDPYISMLLLKLLFDMGLSCYKSKIVLISSHEFGLRLWETCKKFNIDCAWFSDDNSNARPVRTLPKFAQENIGEYDAIVVAEIKDDQCFIGENGLLKSRDLLAQNPEIKVGVIAGHVEVQDMKGAGMPYVPEFIAPPKYMSYQVYQFGSMPVLELYAAGLRVGQVMSQMRRNGASIEETARYALKNSPAMDFMGDLSWL